MPRLFWFISGIFLFLILVFGCGGGGGGPVQPDPEPEPGESRQLWGVYTVTFDPEALTATMVQESLDVLAHLDITSMVSPPACDDCLQVEISEVVPASGLTRMRITLKNPTGQTGYDVRILAIYYTSMDFTEVEGYTDIWSANSERYPFYCFAVENPLRDFGPDASYYRDIEVQFPWGGTGTATILLDASSSGQYQGPYEVNTGAKGWLVNDGVETSRIIAHVYDHQDDIEFVSADLTPLGGTSVQLLDDGLNRDGGANDGIYGSEAIITTVPHGQYDIWVSCKSTGSDLLTYQKEVVTVSDVDPYHCDPDYDRIYDDTQVKRFDIIMTPENWDAMRQDLIEQVQLPWNETDYSYFECEVIFEGNVWEHVGVKHKGFGGVHQAIERGSEKLPFKLDFDEFEDAFPETNDQRFWGIKWMALNNNVMDPSMLREKLTYDLFREAGANAGRVAHYRLYLDRGDGPIYMGLYTSVEAVDERFLMDRFGNDTGNLYKPEEPGGSLITFDYESFVKITNQDDSDWSDVINFINVLNANYEDPQQFKTVIEAIFDVDSFINWLAVNSILCNIDSYAGIGHNYNLYNNPDDGKFYFIPWDCNLSFGGYTFLEADEIAQWDILNPVIGHPPLVEKILWVPEYMDAYTLKVRELLDGPLSESVINPRIDFLHELARPYVVGPNGEFPPYTLLNNQTDFDTNIDYDIPETGPHRRLGLRSFLTDRRAYINSVIP